MNDVLCMKWWRNSCAAPGSSRYRWWHIRSVSCRRGRRTRAGPPADGCEPAIMSITLGIHSLCVSVPSLPKHTHTHTRCVWSPFNICTPAHELTQSITLLSSVLHWTLFPRLMWYHEVADQNPCLQWNGILRTTIKTALWCSIIVISRHRVARLI